MAFKVGDRVKASKILKKSIFYNMEGTIVKSEKHRSFPYYVLSKRFNEPIGFDEYELELVDPQLYLL